MTISTVIVPVKYNSGETGLWKNYISSPKLLGSLESPPFSRWIKYRHILHGNCSGSTDAAEQWPSEGSVE